MYKLKFTRLQNEIFRLLCIKAGIPLNQRKIAKMLKVSPTAIAKSLVLLKKEGLIKVEKDANMNLVSVQFNRDNQKAIDLKRIENLKMFYESGLVKFLEDIFPGTTIILFGSYSRGDDICSSKPNGYCSDIDIAIIGTKGKDIELTKFDKLLERDIIINFYLSFNEIHKHLKDNILNGRLLSGSVDI